MTINGTQTNLGIRDRTDEAGAWAAFRAILDAARQQSGSTIRPEPISQLASEWLDSISHRIASQTRKDYATHLRRLCARFGNAAPGTLDAPTLEKSADPKWSDSHKANYLWVVQAFLRWCGNEKLKLNRPAKESRGADSVISPELHARVLRETTGDFHQLIRFLWATGCRPMEAASLDAEQIDFATGTVTLRRHKLKHKGKCRVIYLSAEALNICQEQTKAHPSGRLFRGVIGKPLTRQAIVTRFIRISAKLGRTVRAYDYRHTYVTRCLEKGIPDVQVAALVGHTSTSMLAKFYSHVAANGRLLRAVAEQAAG